MNYRGRAIDPIALWSEFCEVKEDDGPFLPLTYCPNPEHDNTHSPAFQINIEKPLVHCFAGCGISGTYEHAISIIEGISQREARKRILRHTRLSDPGISRKKKRRSRRSGNSVAENSATDAKALAEEVQRFSYLPPIATDYLARRGITSSSVVRWGIGFDPDERRVVIPAKDERGRIQGLIRRAVRPQDHPKYLYSEDFNKKSLLFGACVIDLGLVRSQGIVLVEGSLDCVRLHQLGVKNACATLGTGISERQVEILESLQPRRVYLMFDKDAAGVASIQSAYARIRKIPLFVCRYPKGKDDPAELSREEAYRSIKNALPMLKFKRLLPGVIRRREVVG